MVRGDGCWLWDEDDRRYLDLTSSHGVAPLGHSHPALTEAIARQAGRLVSCSSSFFNDSRATFLSSLEQVLPSRFKHVFLCNSGTEAIEAARKFAFLVNGRAGVVALKRGFHGRTLGSLALTWNPRFRKPFEALLQPVTFVDPNDTDALDEAFTDDVGLFVAEVIQGESGVYPLDGNFLRTAESLCHERGALFLIDEIQTGVGRTGSWWAHEPLGLEPDLMGLAKGIAGGFPMGAVVSTSTVAEALAPGLHGSTFGGAPLACCAGTATLDALREGGLVEEVARKGETLVQELRSGLADVTLVREIRGRGLMIAIELRTRASGFLSRLMEEHSVLALPAGPTVLRLLPAFVITDEQISTAVDAIVSVLSDS